MSDVPQRIREVFADNDTREDARLLLKRVEKHLSGSGSGGSGGDGMEPRVAKLEAGIAHLERDVSELRIDMRDVRDRLAKLEERVSHLPGKGFIVSVVILALAVITGLIAFQSRIEAFVQQEPVSPASQTSTR
jgi:hypothetical protein